MRFMPIALAASLLALAYITPHSVSESHRHHDTAETSEQLANQGARRGTAHRGSGRRAVLAYELPMAESNG